MLTNSSASSPTATFEPVPNVLEHGNVRLEPLTPQHAAHLLEVGRDESIWTYMPRPPFNSLEDVNRWISEALEEEPSKVQIPFAIVDQDTHCAIGSTRLFDIRKKDRGLEIGWTWLATTYQRTPFNTICKYLLLSHVFDTLGALRVQFKTDQRNERSRKALERIGAQYEGTLRNHFILWNGYVRDSAYYSVIESDWPEVKANLLNLINR